MHLLHRLTLFSVLAILLATTAMGQRRGGDRYAHLGFKTGEAFPDIMLPDVNSGELRSLKEFRGKKLVVLHFASW